MQDQFNSPLFVDVNYHRLIMEHPSTFDQKITDVILDIFRNNVQDDITYITLEDLKKHYKKIIELNHHVEKERYTRDYSFKRNFEILIDHNILQEVIMIYADGETLKGTTKYFYNRLDHNLVKESEELSKEEICLFILNKMKKIEYPFKKLLSVEKIFKNAKQYFHQANYLLHQAISEMNIIEVPLLQLKYNDEAYIDYLFPGQNFRKEVNLFIDEKLIPALRSRFPAITNSLKEIFEEHHFIILEEEIVSDGYRKPIYQLCFMILEARNRTKDISLEDCNLANLILNLWLFLEYDPLFALQDYPNIEIGCDFLSPFFSQYIRDFSHIEEYLKAIKNFVDHLPQVIEQYDLVNFFKSKRVQKKIVEQFIGKLPKDIISIQSLKQLYIISKGQIINAIYHLYYGKFYNSVDSARIEFDVLAKGFYTVEESVSSKEHILKEFKTTNDKYKEAKEILTTNNKVYKDSLKKKMKLTPTLKYRKIYSSKDFKDIDQKMKEKMIKSEKLVVAECLDSKRVKHTIYIRKEDLTLAEAKFFVGMPTYELITSFFDL